VQLRYENMVSKSMLQRKYAVLIMKTKSEVIFMETVNVYTEKIGPIGCSDVSVNVYQHELRISTKRELKVFFLNVYCFEGCSTEIHLDTRITKCSQFTILHELCLVLRVV